MSASLAPQWIFQALTADGKVASGAKLYTFISGTSTPSPLYADEEMTTPLANPLELDAGGYGDFWMDDAKVLRFRLVDSDGELIKERSGVSAGGQDLADIYQSIETIEGDISTIEQTIADLALNDLTDVDTAGNAEGDLLRRGPDGKWYPAHVTISESAPAGAPASLDWIWFVVDPL